MWLFRTRFLIFSIGLVFRCFFLLNLIQISCLFPIYSIPINAIYTPNLLQIPFLALTDNISYELAIINHRLSEMTNKMYVLVGELIDYNIRYNILRKHLIRNTSFENSICLYKPTYLQTTQKIRQPTN